MTQNDLYNHMTYDDLETSVIWFVIGVH